ncbi:uncharacterized protein GWK60_M08261 [Nakaseomyces glabratus]|nr:Protein kinase domain profile [Nakaseomyces glabratus]QNG17069.1 uncharacterized protein GWK60_M08261 [Nakaseomyces glabratus]
MYGQRRVRSERYSSDISSGKDEEIKVSRSKGIDCPPRRRESSTNEDSLYFQPTKIYKLEKELASRSTLVKSDKDSTDEERDSDEIVSNRFNEADSVRHFGRYTDENYQYRHINGLVPDYYEGMRKNKLGLVSDLTNESRNNYIFEQNANFEMEFPIDESALGGNETRGMHDEYIPNLNYGQLIENWVDEEKQVQTMEDLQREDSMLQGQLMKEASMILSNKVRSPTQERSQTPRLATWVNDYDSEPRIMANRSSSVIPEALSDDDIREDSLSPNTSAIFSNSHAQVEPIPLPSKNSSRMPTSTLEDRRSYMNFLGKPASTFGAIDSMGMSALKNVNSFLPIHKSSLPSTIPVRKGSSGQSTANSDSSSLNLQHNLSSSVGDLKLDSDQMMDLIRKLPKDFLTLPYSQRKKQIIKLAPDKDSRLIMSLLKKVMITNSKSASSIQKPGMRSRHGSLASQFLSSFSPSVASMASSGGFRPDDKGLFIMGHKLGKVIGFGAWGMIRECVDIQSGAQRAMKIVRFKDNQKVKRNVIREVNVWKEMHHMYILPLLDWKLISDYAMYCLTERVKDGTLYDLVLSWEDRKNNQIPVDERIKLTMFLMLQLISALKYMHSNSTVHGDIKLENCLLKKGRQHKNWTIFLCDFGMSCRFGSYRSRYDTLIDEEKNNSGIIREESYMPLSFEASPKPIYREVSQLNSQHSQLSSQLTPQLQLQSNSASFSQPQQFLAVQQLPQPEPSLPHVHSDSNSTSQPPSKFMKIVTDRNVIHDDTPFEILTARQASRRSFESHNSKKSQKMSTVSVESLPSSPSATPLDNVNAFDPCSLDAQRHFSLSVENSNTKTPSSLIGSLPYAAPELLVPEPSPLGPGADIWALGVTMYTMLMGKLPFKHDLESKLKQLIASGKFDKKSLKCMCNGGHSNLSDETLKYQGLYDAILGCLTINVLDRWGLHDVETALREELKKNGELSQ